MSSVISLPELSYNQMTTKEYSQNDQKNNISSSTSSVVNLKKGKWSPDEDQLLSNFVKTYNYKNWKLISQHIKGRSAIQCLHRWTKILQPGLVKGPWTAQEDAKLYEWIKKQGPTKWTLCSATIPGRSGKQCREHWNNSLNPEVKKGLWNAEEDFLIMFFYKKFNGSWKKISPLFNQRTENSIKNRFFSQLRKIASIHIQSKEKKFSSKIKLDTLLNYLPEATAEAKLKFLKEKKITEEELEQFLKEKEKKINMPTSSVEFPERIEKEQKNKENVSVPVEDINKKTEFNYDNYDLEMLEREIFDMGNHNNGLLDFENDQLFEDKLDTVINNVFSNNVDFPSEINGKDCIMCSKTEEKGDIGGKDTYVALMNKLIDLEQKVQETKRELQKYEGNNL